MGSLTLHCVMAAAMAYHLSVPALQAIRTVEGGQERQEVCGNADGSCDLGPFQVNDKAWGTTLASALHTNRRTVLDTLRDDGCWNAQVASWILKQELDADGGNLKEAIGDYHSHWRRAHDSYLRQVLPILQTLSPGEAPPAMPGTEPGDSPGALRIPRDVSGDVAPAPAGNSALPKGKMVQVGKPASPHPPAAESPAAPEGSTEPDKNAETAPQSTTAPSIYRGVGGS